MNIVCSPEIATPVPILLAGMLIFSATGQILLIQENYGRYAYGLPGGHVETNESPLTAAVREVAEETGLQVQADRALAFYSFANTEPCLACIFLGSIIGEQLTLPSTGEIATVGWFGPERLPHPINTTAVYALQDAQAGYYGAIRTLTI
jgi:ADP-ribose pyrophosphatase YjhB (NUDIX family)